MQESVRELIVQFLAARLEKIQTANGFSVDATVQRAQLDVDPAGLPAAVIWDADETADREDFGGSRVTLPVRVELIGEPGTDNPSVYGNRLLRDLRMAVEVYGDELAKLAESVVYSRGEIVYPEAGKTVVAVSVVFTIVYLTAKGDPTSRPFV